MTTRTNLDQFRRNRAMLEAEIRNAGSTIRGTRCNCPSPKHRDEHPSAGIFADAKGVWRVMCHSCGFCGDVFDVRAAITGKPLAEVLRDMDKELRGTASNSEQMPDMASLAKRYNAAIRGEQRQALADGLSLSVDALLRLDVGWCKRDGAYSFPMCDAGGNVTGIRLRRGDNKFAERGGHDGLFVPAELVGNGPLCLPEGPTDCAALLDMGFDAIGRANNSARVTDELIAEYLSRNPRNEVWIITDADPAGSRAARATRTAADRLAARLAPIVGTAKVFSPPSPHKDVRAWRIAGATMDDVKALADATPSRGPARELHAMFAAEIDGTRRAIQFPWPLVSCGTQAQIPGTVTLIVGDPGSGKSLLLLESLMYWHNAGLKVAIFELEQTRAEHLKRALAQRVGAARLTNLEVVAANPDMAKAYLEEHATWLDSFGRCIFDAPSKPVTLDALLPWIEARAAEGARIIAIDPVTAAAASDRPWDDAQRFLQTVMPILDRYGASLLLVSHPRKGMHRAAGCTLDDLAGGAAWQRFAQCILWLERHDTSRNVKVLKFVDGLPVSHTEAINRTLRVMKARNGPGTGWQIAFNFDGKTLRFHERGAIVKAGSTTSIEADT